MKIIFSHGKESGPWGSKITTLANAAKNLGATVESLDYTNTLDPDQRVQMLLDHLNHETEAPCLVGSSMGGYVSTVAALKLPINGLFLLAPALYLPGYSKQTFEPIQCHIEIVHGWSDDIVPVEHSLRFAREQDCAAHFIKGDHRLNSSIEEVEMLFRLFLSNRLDEKR